MGRIYIPILCHLHQLKLNIFWSYFGQIIYNHNKAFYKEFFIAFFQIQNQNNDVKTEVLSPELTL